jgi:hypothetical protein
MKYTIGLLKREELFKHWEEVALLLAPALGHARGQYTMADIKRSIAQDKWGCLTVTNETGAIVAALVAAIVQYPQCRSLYVLFLGGVDGLHWGEGLLMAVDDLARHVGCSRIEFQGRKEWGNVLRRDGYEVVSTLYEKVLPPCNISSGDRSTETAPLP